MTPKLSKNQLKYLTSLKQKKYRKKYQEFLVEGLKLCEEALDSSFSLKAVYNCPAISGLNTNASFLQQVKNRDIQLFEINTITLKRLADTVTSQGVFGLVESRNYDLEDIEIQDKSLVVAVENLADPGNLGTLIRTADWFGAAAMILDQGSADWLNPKVIRASMGSVFHLPIVADQNLPEIIDYFSRKNYISFGTSLDGDALTPNHLAGHRKLVILGNEARGLSNELKAKVDYCVKIRGFGNAESLNVGIAGGILMYFFRQGESVINKC